MALDELMQQMPDWAKDIGLNLDSIARTAGLNANQIWGSALAAALATRDNKLIKIVKKEAEVQLSPEMITAVHGCAAVMTMNNIYYRFVHLIDMPEYTQMPARLRMSILAKHGADKIDFELWSIAVSAVNGCGMCLKGHESKVVELGADREMVQNVVRIAAIITASATVISAQ